MLIDLETIETLIILAYNEGREGLVLELLKFREEFKDGKIEFSVSKRSIERPPLTIVPDGK